MILSFISLLLAFSQDQITKICVSKAVADSMLPCRPDAESTSGNKRWLLALVLTESHLKRRILAASGSVVDCPQFASLDPSLSGKSAEPVYRDAKGKAISKEELLKPKEEEKPKFTNFKYSRVEIDEVRFEWAECMLDYI
ncbi:hypothetical protein ZIOFF_010324 [Zingiber officinale]|uniref:Uncharacterized protein n=1 Tax=Zingiber officinale TaxID=94328 RepID=A0A8J5HGT5_ZINOF|nr:hypothetical protein ZIOFF_010324 [Zingiber officinale]